MIHKQYQVSFCVSAQLVRDDVIMWRRLSLAEPIPRLISGIAS